MVLLGGQLGLYIIRKALLFIILGKEKSKEVGSWENTLKTKIKNLIVIHVFKPIKKYPRKSIALVAIILSLTISLYIWFKADAWVTLVATGDGWYYAPWMSRFEITYSYFVAFSKIALINIWIFTSAFLLLKVIPDNKIEGEK